jgi:antirestriction protein ArdC
MPSATETRREEFAERVVRSLEAGVIPWQRKELPDAPIQSAVSGREYSGLNALYLMEKCAKEGYSDPRFITVSEANKNGLYVRKGEKGTVLEHWAQDSDGKIKPHGYSVFNVQQLNGSLPMPEKGKSNLEHAAQMLENAGIEIKPGSVVKEYRDAIEKLAVKNAEEAGLSQNIYKPELLALRYNIASTMVMREAGIPVEQTEGAPMKSWAASIKHDPSQLAKAARDGSLIGSLVLKEMTQNQEAELPHANQERPEAQEGQEPVSEAASQSHQNHTADATALAKQKMGQETIVTSAKVGRTYSGEIIGIAGSHPDTVAIQRISGNQAVLHKIRDIETESNISVGNDLSITKGEDGKISVKTQEEAAKEKDREEECAR